MRMRTSPARRAIGALPAGLAGVGARGTTLARAAALAAWRPAVTGPGALATGWPTVGAPGPVVTGLAVGALATVAVAAGWAIAARPAVAPAARHERRRHRRLVARRWADELEALWLAAPLLRREHRCDLDAVDEEV